MGKTRDDVFAMGREIAENKDLSNAAIAVASTRGRAEGHLNPNWH